MSTAEFRRGPEPSVRSGPRSRWRRVGLVAGLGLQVPVVLWTLLSWGWFDPFPVWFRAALIGGFLLILTAAAAHRRRHRLLAIAVAGGLLFAIAGRLRHQPPAQPPPDLPAVLDYQPTATWQDDALVVRNVRNARHHGPGLATVRWEDRRYRLDDLAGADLIIVPIASWPAIAHTLVSFRFANGEHLAVSFEAETRAHRPYHPVAGCFQRYTLRCVIGDERDLIGRRLQIDGDPVFIFPLTPAPAELRSFLLALLARANALAATPEFYDSLTNSCTSNLVATCQVLTRQDLGWDWRRWLPGHADALAIDHGLIAAPAGRAPLRERCRVRGDTTIDPASAASGPYWSAKIRGRLTDR